MRETARQGAALVVPSAALSLAPLHDPSPPMPRSLGTTGAASIAELLELSRRLGLGHHGSELARLAECSLRLLIEEPTSSLSLGRAAGDARVDRPQEPMPGRTLLRLNVPDRAPADRGLDVGTLWCLLTPGRTCQLRSETESRSASNVAWPSSSTRALSVRVMPELVLPRVWDRSVQGLGLDNAEQDTWQLLRQQLADLQGTDLPSEEPGPRVIHRLLGYADDRRGDMPLACELLSRGLDLGIQPARAHERAAELEPVSGRWRLLMQLSSDDRLDWAWGGGQQRMYVWIDRDDLARGDLSRTQTVVR